MQGPLSKLGPKSEVKAHRSGDMQGPLSKLGPKSEVPISPQEW